MRARANRCAHDLLAPRHVRYRPHAVRLGQQPDVRHAKAPASARRIARSARCCDCRSRGTDRHLFQSERAPDLSGPLRGQPRPRNFAVVQQRELVGLRVRHVEV